MLHVRTLRHRTPLCGAGSPPRYFDFVLKCNFRLFLLYLKLELSRRN